MSLMNDVFVNVCTIENVKKMWKYVNKFIYMQFT